MESDESLFRTHINDFDIFVLIGCEIKVLTSFQTFNLLPSAEASDHRRP